MAPSKSPKKSIWKPLFLDVLRTSGNVTRSAKSAGIDRVTAYRERNASDAFKQQWDDALEEGVDTLEEEARRRALEGIPVPVYSKGEYVGETQQYSDTLMMFLLKGRRPQVYKDRHDITTDGEKISFTLKLGERSDDGDR